MSTTGQGENDDRPLRWTWADTGWLLAIALAGLALRLVYVLEYAAHPLGRLPWVDEGAYWSRGLEILGGHWLPGRPFYQDPLLPYFLAALMKLAGSGVATLRVVLACIGASTPVVDLPGRASWSGPRRGGHCRLDRGRLRPLGLRRRTPGEGRAGRSGGFDGPARASAPRVSI